MVRSDPCPSVALDIFLLVDVSGSMGGTWNTLANALDRFSADLGPDDNLTLATFSFEGNYHLVQQVPGNQASSIVAHLKQLQVDPKVGTDILGALREAGATLGARTHSFSGGNARVPILLVLTDGQDTNPEINRVLVETGVELSTHQTDGNEGFSGVVLYQPTEATFRAWGDLYGAALVNDKGEYPLTLFALFEHPIIDASGRPIPGTNDVRGLYDEVSRLQPELNLQTIDLQRGMTLPIGVICAVPSVLDFGNITGNLSEPTELRFVVRGRSGAIRLPSPSEIRIQLMPDPEIVRNGAGVILETSGGNDGSLSLSLRLMNPDNLTPDIYDGGMATLALPDREGEIIFLIPDRIPYRFRTDLTPSICQMESLGSFQVERGGAIATGPWRESSTVIVSCEEAAGSEGLSVRAGGIPPHVSLVFEDGFGQEVARLDADRPEGRIPSLGEISAHLDWGRRVRFRGEISLSFVSPRSNVQFHVKGPGLEIDRKGAILTWQVVNIPPLPWWVFALIALAIVLLLLSLRATFSPRAKILFSGGLVGRPSRVSIHPLLFGSATCSLVKKSDGSGAIKRWGSRGHIGRLVATRQGITLISKKGGSRHPGRPIKPRSGVPLVEGTQYRIEDLSFSYESGKRRRRKKRQR